MLRVTSTATVPGGADVVKVSTEETSQTASSTLLEVLRSYISVTGLEC